MRVLRFVAILLLAAYGLAATIVLVFDDHRYHTTLFAPVPGHGWHAADDSSCGKVKAPGCIVVRFTYLDCTQFNPVQCWLYPNRGIADRELEYDTEDLKLTVRFSDLKYPATGPVEPDSEDLIPELTHGKIQIHLTITGRTTVPPVDRNRIRLVGPCGPGVRKNADGTFAMTTAESFTLQPTTTNPLILAIEPNEFETQIVIDADRTAIQECTLRLRDALGLPIPDVTFRAIPVAHYAIVPGR